MLTTDREELLLQDCEWKIRETEKACKDRIMAAEQLKQEAIRKAEKVANESDSQSEKVRVHSDQLLRVVQCACNMRLFILFQIVITDQTFEGV